MREAAVAIVTGASRGAGQHVAAVSIGMGAAMTERLRMDFDSDTHGVLPHGFSKYAPVRAG